MREVVSIIGEDVGPMNTKIAAQLYTLREFMKTTADLASTLKKVRSIGYSAVQVSAIGPIPSADVAQILGDNGLVCCATHTSIDALKSDAQAVIAELKSWNCKYTAIGGYFPKAPTTDDWIRFADEFNGLSKAFVGTGIALGYHNHSHELIRYDGKTALQMLVDRLDPSIFFEIDTYWIAAGGGDPAAWISKLAGRVPCVHLKDMGMDAKNQQFMMEVGEGNLNWPGILRACKKAGVEWHTVEQDTCYRDPFDSLAISLKNLQGMGSC